MTSVLLCRSATSDSVMRPLFFIRFYSVLIDFTSQPLCLFHEEFRFHFTCPAFSSLFNRSNIFVSCSCMSPCVTTIMSSSQACVQYSKVRSIFFLKYCGLVKLFVKLVLFAKPFPGDCEYALSACFF